MTSVLGIGPAEPEDWESHNGPFASHYDSGRITRRIDAKRQWAILASRSIEQYRYLEEQSGISFHQPSGVVFVRNDPPGIERLTAVSRELDLPVEIGPVADKLGDLPMLNLPPDYTVIREPGPAGAIDPRRMIEAQQRAAADAGASLERDVVLSIRTAEVGYELSTAAGRTHRCRQVLVTAGAYSNDLFAPPLAIAVRPESVVLGLIQESEAERLRPMPSVLYLLNHPELDDVYIVPPAKYPDGRWYIKIGGSQHLAPTLASSDAMNHSMRAGSTESTLGQLKDVLQTVLPDVTFSGWHAKPCLITDTATGLPYIDRLHSGVTVAFGGNGHAAKSSDAIGALAAGLALDGQWIDEELAGDDFAARFGDYSPPDGSRHGN